MNPKLPITEEDVAELRKANIHSSEDVREILRSAVTLRRKKQEMPPQLDRVAGLCQKALLNMDAFKVMVRLQRKQEEAPAE